MKTRINVGRLAALCMLTLLLTGTGTTARAYDGAAAGHWLERFAQALAPIAPLNDAEQTEDPARAGQYLIEYPFGTVLSAVPETPAAQEILAIDVRTGQVTDCRGVRVGMGLEAALDGEAPAASSAPLTVLDVQEGTRSWSWAYSGEGGIYGVEYIGYADEEQGVMEYALTYVLEEGVIAAIRLRRSSATAAQALDGLKTAQEMAEKQRDACAALKNRASVFSEEHVQIQGQTALGIPVERLVARLGEPVSIQTLPQAQGRILLYDGAAVRLAFHEMTGEERVRGVSVSSAAYAGPNGLRVGMQAADATGLFRCEQDIGPWGGTLYLAGEAEGEAPYGEIIALNASEKAMLLRYACLLHTGETVLLEAGIENGEVTYWALSYAEDAEEGLQ